MEWWWNQYSSSSCSLLMGWCCVLYDPWRSLNVWFVRWRSHGKRVCKEKKQNKTIKAVTAQRWERFCTLMLWSFMVWKNPLMYSSVVCFSPHLPYCQGKSTKLDSADFIKKKKFCPINECFFKKFFWNSWLCYLFKTLWEDDKGVGKHFPTPAIV